MAPILCVHAAAFGKDVVFRFAAARFFIEGGALAVRAATLPHADLMAFAPGVWKAAWHEDEMGAPLGLLPEHNGAPPPQMAPEPLSSGASAPDDQIAVRADRERRILASLNSQSYQGLSLFAESLGEPPGEVERALVSLLQHKGIDPDKIALAPMQSRLDAMLPALISTRQPQGVREIMQHLRQHPDARDCDYVQLHIWLRRNPVKRAS